LILMKYRAEIIQRGDGVRETESENPRGYGSQLETDSALSLRPMKPIEKGFNRAGTVRLKNILNISVV
jgi:hypothetical protein